MFNLTAAQCRDAGVEPSILDFLPEDEAVLQLSEIASNLPSEEEKEEPENEEGS